jgi:hypothetical protein
MTNVFNFVERFAPLSSLKATILELDSDKFIVAPEDTVSCNFQDDHVVVWYKRPGGRPPPIRPNGRVRRLQAGHDGPIAD